MNTKSEPTPELHPTSRGPAHVDYDLVCELMHRQEAFRRCDQYILSSEFPRELQAFWEAIKTQEARNLKRNQELLAGRSNGLLFLLPDPPVTPILSPSANHR